MTSTMALTSDDFNNGSHTDMRKETPLMRTRDELTFEEENKHKHRRPHKSQDQQFVRALRHLQIVS